MPSVDQPCGYLTRAATQSIVLVPMLGCKERFA